MIPLRIRLLSRGVLSQVTSVLALQGTGEGPCAPVSQISPEVLGLNPAAFMEDVDPC